MWSQSLNMQCMLVCFLSGHIIRSYVYWCCVCMHCLYSCTHVLFDVICERVFMKNENNQAKLLCVFGFNLNLAASLYVIDIGIAVNAPEFRGFVWCYNLESLIIVRVSIHLCLIRSAWLWLASWIYSNWKDVPISEWFQKFLMEIHKSKIIDCPTA